MMSSRQRPRSLGGRPINKRKAETSAVIEGAIKLATKQIMVYLTVQLPFLGWPVVRNLIQLIISKTAHWIVEKTVIGTNMLIIHFDIKEDVSDVEKALDDAVKLPKNASPEEVERANKAIQDALNDLVRVGRSKL